MMRIRVCIFAKEHTSPHCFYSDLFVNCWSSVTVSFVGKCNKHTDRFDPNQETYLKKCTRWRHSPTHVLQLPYGEKVYCVRDSWKNVRIITAVDTYRKQAANWREQVIEIKTSTLTIELSKCFTDKVNKCNCTHKQTHTHTV